MARIEVRSKCAALGVALVVLAALAGCTAAPAPQATDVLYGATRGNFLTRFAAATPTKLEFERRVRGFAEGEEIVGLDTGPGGTLYALSSTGRLYTIDPDRAQATRVGASDANEHLPGVEFGMSFEPGGSIRVVGNTGENVRIDARSGGAIDADSARPGVQPDPGLRYAEGDRNAGRRPSVTAVAHARDRAYVIDRVTGALAALDEASGRLTTIGALGLQIGGPVQFDISTKTGIAYLATVPAGGLATLYSVDLATGRASRLGYIGDASFALRALAVAP